MTPSPWLSELNVAITVCDRTGKIIEMNDKAIATFAKYGGQSLIGQNLLNYHKDSSRSMIQEMLVTGRTNTYTIEKDGKHKLIYQTPWYKNGEIQGLVEFSLEVPKEMPHHIRPSAPKDHREGGQSSSLPSLL